MSKLVLFITKKKVYNNGEKTQYFVENSHPAIITIDVFEQTKEELKRRADTHSPKGRKKNLYPFSGMLICSNCGASYRRKITPKRVVYVCTTYNTLGKNNCASKTIPEDTLKLLTMEVLGDVEFNEEHLKRYVENIVIHNNNSVTFHLKTGSEIIKSWAPLSRKDSWTPEMKEKARLKEQMRQRSM